MSSSEPSTTLPKKKEGVVVRPRRTSLFSVPKFEKQFIGATTVMTASQKHDEQQQHQQTPKQIETAVESAKPNDLHLHRDPVYLWSSLVAAVGSSALASVFCAPLDLVRTRLQVWGDIVIPGSQQQGSGAAVLSRRGHLANIPLLIQDIIRKEGIGGCFRGLGATLITVPAFWGIYFPLYDDLKRHWTIEYPNTGQSWIHMGSAVMAGAVSDVICNPMFVVRTRLQTDALHALAGNGIRIRPKTVSETIRSLYQEGGMLVFWRGMTANIIGLTHVGIQFPVYEALKKKLRLNKRDNAPAEFLAASAFSKMVACLISYPHEVIRSRMQDARAPYVGLFETCQRMYVKEGLLGFYSGLPITLVRVLPNTCLTFLTYELLLQWARSQIEKDRSRRGQ
ncbi:hypothetical protein ACA910_000333 [Epithemia clementina (nom. ined.)]